MSISCVNQGVYNFVITTPYVVWIDSQVPDLKLQYMGSPASKFKKIAVVYI